MEVSRRILEAVGEGDSVLCHGPPLSGKREFLITLLAEGTAAGHPGLFVTSDENAAGLLERYPDAFPDDRTAIVDCTGSPPPGTDHVVQSVRSAADLTGVAVAASKAIERLDVGGEPLVVALDSVTTFSLYADFERVFRFVHSFVQQIQGTGGVLAMTLDDDTIDEQKRSQLQSIVGQRVEFRDAAECRLVDSDGATGEWRRIEERERPSTDPPRDSGSSETVGDLDPEADPASRAGSLAALIADVRSGRPTLTLGNVSDDVDVRPLAERAERVGVTVETTRFAGGEPAGVAMLHEGPTLLAGGALDEAVDALEDPFDDVDGRESPVLAALPTDVYVANAAGRSRLLRASRTIERLALRHGDGTIHAGFQLFSRLTSDADTLAVYERLLSKGVEVHLYGELDAPLPEELEDAVVRGLPAREVGEAWFVVFDGAGEPGAGGALVTRELEAGRYSGFWSYDGAVVEAVVEYLETTYGAVEP